MRNFNHFNALPRVTQTNAFLVILGEAKKSLIMSERQSAGAGPL